MTPKPTHRQIIEAAARADAALFVSEFPGETLEDSDWDAEAFAQLGADAAASAKKLDDDAWPIYREALQSEVVSLQRRCCERDVDADGNCDRHPQPQLITDSMIRQLRDEALAAGDRDQVALCNVALDGLRADEMELERAREVLDMPWHAESELPGAARRLVVQAIAEAAAEAARESGTAAC